MHAIYPCKIEAHPEKGFWATCRDIPEAMTSGRTEEVARFKMEKALRVALNFYTEQGKEHPPSTPIRLQEGEQYIEVEL